MGRLAAALRRARLPIVAVALVYAAGVATGIGLAHAGNQVALDSRDTLVAGARASNPIADALDRGDPLQAAALDLGANLLLGAAPTTIAGLAVIAPFPIVASRGWIGGVVSTATTIRAVSTSRSRRPTTSAR